ncbi:MAG: shikimate kinase [Propionibacteriaceae bacterium]|jgi:shikimate kinase|nr:shikimate kinase [Propionibacteriaceae bacterium]
MIVLIGFMGAGKTTVGQKLAKRLRLPFIDSDELVEAKTGKSIPELFDTVGESGFREIEAEAVVGALGGAQGVLALGGGSLASDEVRTALASHTVIWIEIGYAEALRRISGDANRPLLQGADLYARFTARQKVYEAAADLRLTVDHQTSSRVVDTINELLCFKP